MFRFSDRSSVVIGFLHIYTSKVTVDGFPIPGVL